MVKKILFIGSDNSNILFLQERLSNSFDIATAMNFSDIEKGIRKEQWLIQAILIRMDLFKKNNYEFNTLIRKNLQLISVPLICLSETKSSDEEDIQAEIEALDHGAVEYLAQPFHFRKIEMMLSNVILLRQQANAYMDDRVNILNQEAEAIDAFIIDHFLGAACILEMNEGQVSIVQTNEQFSKELLGQVTPVKRNISQVINKYMDKENCETFLNTIYLASEERRKTFCELIMNNLHPSQPEMHIRVAVKPVEHFDENHRYYCTLENDTEQFEIKKREHIMTMQLMAIIENVSGGLTVGTFNHNHVELIYINDEFFSMIGYTREEFESSCMNDIYQLVYEEDREKLQRAMQKSIENMEKLTMEARVIKKDGTIIWVKGRNSVCYMDYTESPVNVIVYTDITAHKETEMRINAINARLGNSEIFYKLNVTEERIEEYHSIYSKEELPYDSLEYEKLLLASIYEGDKEATYRDLTYNGLMNHFKNGDMKFSIEYRRYIVTGEVHWFVVTAILVEGITDGTVNAFIYARDIDMRMKQRIARDRIVDTDVDDITILNIANRKAQIVKLYNGSSIEEGVANYEQNLEQYIRMEVAEEDQEQCAEFFKLESLVNKVNKDGYADFSYWMISPSGSNRRKNAHVTYLDSTCEDLLIVGRDITLLFEREQEKQTILKQAVDLANYANQSKSDFLAQMSHDMRTPLNAIIGLTDLALKLKNEPEVESYLKNIDHTGKYLLELINDTLDLSKIESGKMEFHEERYPLEEFVQSINTVIKPLMDEKNIEFIMKLDKQATNIVVDKLRFTQVFYNLLSNAAKYTPWGGKVEFFSEKIPGKDGKFGMRFHVRDNGIGMSIGKFFLILLQEKTDLLLQNKKGLV